jgi:hypothetical protein
MLVWYIPTEAKVAVATWRVVDFNAGEISSVVMLVLAHFKLYGKNSKLFEKWLRIITVT